MFLQRNQEENAELKDLHEYILLIGQDVETSSLTRIPKMSCQGKNTQLEYYFVQKVHFNSKKTKVTWLTVEKGNLYIKCSRFYIRFCFEVLLQATSFLRDTKCIYVQFKIRTALGGLRFSRQTRYCYIVTGTKLLDT